ncbi:hypothetical protein UPYG_G00244320 [Umbra pygmaea]|uniref:Uncharacterized protein n=1 Tax=Umbra pygmaea TaxID=75934 RepID=A0ABD0X6J0_UMBPY
MESSGGLGTPQSVRKSKCPSAETTTGETTDIKPQTRPRTPPAVRAGVGNGALDTGEFERIRQAARLAWQRDTLQRENSPTTYGGQHSTKTLDEPTWSRVRPSSPTRRHRPHPC